MISDTRFLLILIPCCHLTWLCHLPFPDTPCAVWGRVGLMAPSLQTGARSCVASDGFVVMDRESINLPPVWCHERTFSLLSFFFSFSLLFLFPLFFSFTPCSLEMGKGVALPLLGNEPWRGIHLQPPLDEGSLTLYPTPSRGALTL